jgi:hypothetical protein
MTFENSIHSATQMALDYDLPLDLLPLTIANLATQLAGLEPGYRAGCWE